ncbi:interleukin-1 family member 10 isoform X3 [Erinaceus europaeus]|uniref:Interleukin-1 family member 10 isoform X3 n=1 Tax=Erinaceus europaeus TaxID=9365 RepID=A0ABM3X348_ERIEU|nr:interleukin-1 family member 10 isoform X3 [Erinaceus europaeus]
MPWRDYLVVPASRICRHVLVSGTAVIENIGRVLVSFTLHFSKRLSVGLGVCTMNPLLLEQRPVTSDCRNVLSPHGPILHDVNIEDLYKGGEEATRFTFFQRSLGSALKLEAAAWPGWFLCGPSKPQQPVGLTKESELSAHTEFYFEQSW